MNRQRKAGGAWCARPANRTDLMRVDYIKKSISPVDFYRHTLTGAKLKRAGWNNGGLCPFHNDTKPGSFYVNLTTGAFKCFSCGEGGGDIVAFTQKIDGLTFPDAMKKISSDWGLA